MLMIAAAATALAAWLLVSPRREDRLRQIAAGDPGDALSRMRDRLQESRFGPWAGRRRDRALRREVHALVALVAELRAGQPPDVALIHAAGTPPVWPAAVTAAHCGSDVVDGLRRDACDAGAAASLAVCWRSVVMHGASLSDAVARIAVGARAAQDARASLAAELAGPRATARVLALLPLIGIALGMLMGGAPLAWLVGTKPGWLCLVAGVTLIGLGTWWTSRIAARVELML